VSTGRIIGAFGDRPAAEVTTAEVSGFLRSLDREGLKPRNVNKHRQVLAAMFTYACRADTYALPGESDRRDRQAPRGPAGSTRLLRSRRGRGTRALLRTGTPACGQALTRPGRDRGKGCRGPPRRGGVPAPVLDRPAALGEVLTLRWEDVDLQDRLLLSAVASPPARKRSPRDAATDWCRSPAPAARLADRDGFTGLDDYVLAIASVAASIPPRYDAATSAAARPPACALSGCTASGTPPAASLPTPPTPSSSATSSATRSSPPPNCCLSARPRPEELKRLDEAFHPRDDQRPRTVVLRRPAGTRTRPLPIARTWVRVGIARVSPGRRNCHT
jgi:hypothetical protein